MAYVTEPIQVHTNLNQGLKKVLFRDEIRLLFRAEIKIRFMCTTPLVFAHIRQYSALVLRSR